MQHRSIYISAIQPRSGSLLVTIGIMEMLKGHFKKVAFFRPIIGSEETHDENIEFIRNHYKLDITYELCVGFTEKQVIGAYAQNREEEIIEAIIGKIALLHKQYDFVLIEGYPRDLFSTRFDFDINLRIARNIGTAYIPVLNAYQKQPDEIINELRIVSEVVDEEGCNHLATFVNRCNETDIPTLKQKVVSTCKKKAVYFISDNAELDRPSLAEVVNHLHAEMIIGESAHLDRLVYGNKIAAMGADNYLTHIQNGDLVIVPGDRSDIILLSLLSYYGKHHPNIAALIFSGGITPSETILKLIRDIEGASIPLFLVESDSYTTAIALENLPPSISHMSKRKITLAKALFDTAVDKARLRSLFEHQESDILTPMMFQYRIMEKARANRQRIILPESGDERILRATEIVMQRRIAHIILLGKNEKIIQDAKRLGINLGDVEIIDPSDTKLFDRFSRHFYEMRKEKGLTHNAAEDAMTHLSYFATMMVYEGMADGMVSGAVHTTADTIRPALQIIKTEPGTDLVSSVFFMLLETKVLVYGDCAINLDPNAKELAHIALSSAKTARQFGIEPRVAMLSYSTGDSGSGPDVEKVKEATLLAQQMCPDLLIEGPMQYDAAVDPNVAAKKLPHSRIAGRATVFIFPDLNTGNNTYKAVQRSTGALAIGPVLQGLRLPVNDLSRGCSVDDIVNTIAITAIQAQGVTK